MGQAESVRFCGTAIAVEVNTSGLWAERATNEPEAGTQRCPSLSNDYGTIAECEVLGVQGSIEISEKYEGRRSEANGFSVSMDAGGDMSVISKL
jgi:hypothetical protein